jgi:hypothetical protein
LAHAKEFTDRINSETVELRRKTRRLHIGGALVTFFMATLGTLVVHLFQHMRPMVLVLALVIDVIGGFAYYGYLRLSFKRKFDKTMKELTLAAKPTSTT